MQGPNIGSFRTSQLMVIGKQPAPFASYLLIHWSIYIIFVFFFNFFFRWPHSSPQLLHVWKDSLGHIQMFVFIEYIQKCQTHSYLWYILTTVALNPFSLDKIELCLRRLRRCTPALSFLCPLLHCSLCPGRALCTWSYPSPSAASGSSWRSCLS